jgi:hypothetical protein
MAAHAKKRVNITRMPLLVFSTVFTADFITEFPCAFCSAKIAQTVLYIQFWDNPFLGSDCAPPIHGPWRRMQKSLKSPEYARLIGMLVAVRKKAEIRQQLLAKKLGKPQSFVAKYEGGERRIDLVEFVAIVRALDGDPVALFRDFVAQEPRSKSKGKSPSK